MINLSNEEAKNELMHEQDQTTVKQQTSINFEGISPETRLSPRSKSLVFVINNDTSRLTSFKSRHFELPEMLSETVLNSKESGGFRFIINFNELHFSLKNDLIASGGYGDVYKGKWLGLPVAIKKFGKKYVSK